MRATWIGFIAVLGAGCGTAVHHDKATSTGAVVTPSGRHLSKVSTKGTPRGEQTVRIEVVVTSTRPNRQTLALVPVFIGDQGPFPFAVDTGASRSLIAGFLATRLHLASRGSAGMLRGVAGAASAENFAVETWRAGSVRLPPSMIAAIGSATPSATATGTPRGPMGLLGSDVLSRYGKIAIDYDKGLLVLDPRIK